jgi:hypothetical protein
MCGLDSRSADLSVEGFYKYIVESRALKASSCLAT